MNTLLVWVWAAGVVPIILSLLVGMPYIAKYVVFDSRANELLWGGYLAAVLALPVGWLSVTAAFPKQFGTVTPWQVEALIWVNLAFIVHACAWWTVWWFVRWSNLRSQKAALNDKKLFNKAKRQRVKRVRSSR